MNNTKGAAASKPGAAAPGRGGAKGTPQNGAMQGITGIIEEEPKKKKKKKGGFKIFLVLFIILLLGGIVAAYMFDLFGFKQMALDLVLHDDPYYVAMVNKLEREQEKLIADGEAIAAREEAIKTQEQTLQTKQEQLDAREEELNNRQSELDAQEQEIGKAKSDTAQIAAIYAAMEPKNAADALSKFTNTSMVVEILSAMTEKKASAILDEMEPSVAASVSMRMMSSR